MHDPKDVERDEIGTVPFKTAAAMVYRMMPELPQDTARARIAQWQRAGVPEEVNVGRGTRCRYTYNMLLEMAAMAELTTLGIPCLVARSIIRDRPRRGTTCGSSITLNWSEIKRRARTAMLGDGDA